ncbi:MAG: FmdB family zinc ribbon protein [Vicinamibacterales bacterium]
MPLYEYQCQSCSHQFEVIQKFSDPLVETCPVCTGPVVKLLSSPAIQFKGTGWYITDYARKGGSDVGKAEKKPASADKPATTSSESSSTETKPASGATSSGTGGKSE